MLWGVCESDGWVLRSLVGQAYVSCPCGDWLVQHCFSFECSCECSWARCWFLMQLRTITYLWNEFRTHPTCYCACLSYAAYFLFFLGLGFWCSFTSSVTGASNACCDCCSVYLLSFATDIGMYIPCSRFVPSCFGCKPFWSRSYTSRCKQVCSILSKLRCAQHCCHYNHVCLMWSQTHVRRAWSIKSSDLHNIINLRNYHFTQIFLPFASSSDRREFCHAWTGMMSLPDS